MRDPDRSGKQKGPSLLLRCCFGIAIFLLWGLLTFLGLEVYERIRCYRAIKAYDGYVRLHVGNIPGMTRAPGNATQEASAPAPAPQSAAPSSTSAIPPVSPEPRGAIAALPPLDFPARPVPAESVRAFEEAFAQRTQENRAAVTAMRGDYFLRLDRNRRVLESYGEPRFEQYTLTFLRGTGQHFTPGQLCDAINSFTHMTQPARSEFDYLYSHYVLETTPRIGPDGTVEEAAFLLHDASCGTPFAVPESVSRSPEDSEWDIDMFRYKRDFHRSTVITNHFGFKDHDVALPKPKGLFRIVCVGGSTTEEGDIQAPRYTSMLQESMDAHFGPGTVEVLNCGICGGDSYLELRRVMDYLALEPDLILHYNAVNDMALRHIPVFCARVETWQRMLRSSYFLNHLFNRAFLPPDEQIIAYLKDTTLRNLRGMACAARAHGAGIAFCSFAYPDPALLNREERNYLDVNLRSSWIVSGGKYPDYPTYCLLMNLYAQQVQSMCAELGLPYIPVAENFHAGMDHFQDVCHSTPKGMRRKAGIIAAYLIPYIERVRREAPASPTQ